MLYQAKRRPAATVPITWGLLRGGMVSCPVAMSLNVLFVIAELAPLIKVGGIGDVGGSLPRALRRLGHDVRVALPYYAAIDRQQVAAERLGSLPQGATIWQAEVRGVPVYLIEHEAFGREEVYGYDDDPARFLAFCDALLSSTEALAWRPDLLHVHDWHPGFIATRLTDRPEHPWANLPLISTVHNLAFTGPFDAAFAREHGFAGEALASPRGLAQDLPNSALAQAILHADLVSTVSPTYAGEILTAPFGGALAPLLQRLGDRLSGILNGIDTEEYDPAQDPHLAARFDAEHLDRRIENKRALQRQLSLPLEDDVPLVGMVSRLFWQKGPDLAVTAIERLLSIHGSDDRPPGRLQFAALGKGDEEQERPLAELAARHPQQVAVRFDFDLPLGQLIYGGCDLFLMPSRYEPCGLGQLIAMRYGAVPVVRHTGGLADSVEPFDATRGLGTGFVFEQESPLALSTALEEAFAAYQNRADWHRLQLRGMAQDFSWDSSARQYSELYERATHLRSRAATSEEARNE